MTAPLPYFWEIVCCKRDGWICWRQCFTATKREAELVARLYQGRAPAHEIIRLKRLK